MADPRASRASRSSARPPLARASRPARRCSLSIPLQRGLGLDQQYQRSLKLVELALDTLESCVGPTPLASVQAVADSARRRLRRVVGVAVARREPDGFESNLDLAERLWELRTTACGRPAGTSRDPLGLVLAKIAQEDPPLNVPGRRP